MGWNVHLQQWIASPRKSTTLELVETGPEWIPCPHALMALVPGVGPLPVTSGLQTSSRWLIDLQPYATLRLLALCVLKDGTRRASITFDGLTSSVGWVTVMQVDGTPYVMRYAEPMYEVVAGPLKSRRQYSTSSRFVAQLDTGTRVHLVDAKRLSDGSVRAQVVVAVGRKARPFDANPKALGWITAIKADGRSTLVRRAYAPIDKQPGPATQQRLQLCTPAYTPIPNAMKQSAARPMPSNPIDPTLHAHQGDIQIELAHRGVSLSGFIETTVMGEMPRGFNAEPQGGRLEAGRASHSTRSPARSSPQLTPASLTLREYIESSEGVAQDFSPGGNRAIERASKGKTPAPEVKKPKELPLAKSSEIRSSVNVFLEMAAQEEAKLGGGKFSTFTVKLGQKLQALVAEAGGNEKAVYDRLIRDWDPNRDVQHPMHTTASA